MGTPHNSIFSGHATPWKSEGSFKQWYHKVWCIRDHYLEAVVQGIIGLLKGASVDMTQYIGPAASVEHILWKLSAIFGMVASFDLLMQNFY